MKLPGIIALVNCDEELVKAVKDFGFPGIDFIQFDNGIQLNAKWQKQDLNILAIIAEAEILSASGIALKTALENRQLPSIPFILIAVTINEALLMMALNAGITEVFHHPVSISQLQEKLNFLLHNWDELIKTTASKKITVSYKIPVGKRIFDILFSLLALLLLSPLFLLFALFIKLESKGPVFYYSLRAGSGYKIFKFYKFRSMYVDADKRGLLTIGKDTRITSSGYYLRKYKLDELPQLFNVLTGSMSIVGPRPEVKKYVDLYTDEQKKILNVRPGITDLASIKYKNENDLLHTQSDPEQYYIAHIMPEKIRFNNIFIKSPTPANYFKIIFMTIGHVFKRGR